MVEAVADRGRAAGRCRRSRPARSRRRAARRCPAAAAPSAAKRCWRRRAPAHRLGPGEAAHDPLDRAAQHRRGRLARAVDHREQHAVALDQLLREPVLRRKPSSACGGAEARGPLISSAPPRSPAAGRARSAPAGAASRRSRSRRPRARPWPAPRRTSAPGRCAPAPASAPGSPPTAARAGSRRASRDRLASSRMLAALAQLMPPSPAIAHPADIGLPLGDRDHPARLQRVEDVAGLDRLLIGRDGELALEAVLRTPPPPCGRRRTAVGARPPRNSTRSSGARSPGTRRRRSPATPGVVELEVEDIVDALDVHRQPLQPVGELARDRRQSKPPTCWK
jgi:hypothetical protein